MNHTQHDSQTCDPNAQDARKANPEFEIDCVDLICRQESTLSRLSDASQHSRTAESLGFAKQMLVEFLDFAESRFSDEEFAEVTKRVYAVYERTKELEALFNQESWQGLKRLFGVDSATSIEAAQEYQRLGLEYASLYAEFFAVCVKRFHSDAAVQKEFLQSVDLFLTDLKRRW